jgi:long-chain acyl-CoA synthetase
VPDVGTAETRALYLYTSGSTDTFKRVCCTQSNLWFEAENFVTSTRQSAADAILCAVPLNHSYGLGNGLLDAAYAGATLVLEPDTQAPFAARHAAMLSLLRAEDIAVFLGVPFQYEVLAASSEDIAAAFAAVRWCVSSGDVLRRQIFETFRARTGQPIRSLYGSTEAGSIAMDVGPADGVRFDDLGAPLANVTIEARGPHGEIWVRSPTLPPGGYDNRPELNPVVFRDGFYNSGDLGTVDARGHLSITGRKQSFFDVGGYKVDLGEVEEALRAHPQVREVAVVGVEAPGIGGVLKAVVAAHETCREADILDHCRRHLAPFKTPRFIEFREMLPRSPLGKVLRAELGETADWLIDVPSAQDIPPGTRARQADWLARRIQEQVAIILSCKPSEIARDAPFQSLDLDSLRVVELQERLSLMSGVALTITTLWNYPSIDAYADFLLAAMLGEAPATGRAERGADDLDAVPDEEIAALLARELNSGARTP